MLKQRIITALILIPLVIAGLFYLPPALFFLFTFLIFLGGAWEWSNLAEIKKISARLFYLGIFTLAVLLALFIPIFLLFSFAVAWWVVVAFLILFYPGGPMGWRQSHFLRGIMGLFVLIPPLAAINFIRDANGRDGVYSLLFLFVLIWGADSAAYFVGKKWGKNKLLPHVSPGKTREGLYGAMTFSILFSLLAAWFSHIPIRLWLPAVLLSVITILFSIVGDLFESMLKREAKLKDSGKLLPGHGGLLDRIDSLTAAAPVFATGTILLGMYLGH